MFGSGFHTSSIGLHTNSFRLEYAGATEYSTYKLGSAVKKKKKITKTIEHV